MMTESVWTSGAFVWPVLLLCAWFAAERLHAWWRVPRVSSYVGVGLMASAVGLPGLGALPPGLFFLANLALALVLFELGYRINLRWFWHNPWVLMVGLVESAVTFLAVFWVSGWFALPIEVRLIIAALAVSASPAGIVRVANELRGSGQVTERVMHLCAINALVAVVLVTAVVGYWQLRTTGEWLSASVSAVYAMTVAVALGGALGVCVPWLLRQTEVRRNSATVLFALLVLLLVTLSSALQISPLLAALSFGIVARERRIELTPAQRDFGSLGDLLGVFLFVYVASLMQWSHVWSGLALAVTVLGVRLVSKVGCNALAARWSGITLRKGALTGLALTPMSAFAVLLLEHSRLMGFEPAVAAWAAMAALLVLQELLGPWITQRSLMAAQETHADGVAPPLR